MEEFSIARPRPWLLDEVEKLRAMAPHHSLAELSSALERSPGAVATKALQEKIRFSVSRQEALPPIDEPAPQQLEAPEFRRLMKARWIEGIWKTSKATATFYEGEEGKLPADFRAKGAWADIEPAPGFANEAANEAMRRDGYYVWPQTVID